MASTLLEQARALHEENERLERLIVKDFRNDTKTHKEKLFQAHRVRRMLDAIQDNAKKLEGIYRDDDGARKEEIAALRGDNPFAVFNERLREVRDYHRRHQYLDITEAEDDEALLKEEPAVAFSGEESLGRYLDLHEQYNYFMNAKFGRQLDYLDYLDNLTNFCVIPRHLRYSPHYRDYLGSLLDYLSSFYQRTQPLGDLGKRLAKVEDTFAADWAAGRVPHWGPAAQEGLPSNALMPAGALDLDAFESVEELEALGADRLKEALQSLGVKCGGTLQQRAQRLWLTQGKSLDQLDRKLLAKGSSLAAVTGEGGPAPAAAKKAALLELKVSKALEALGGVLAATKGNVEKKLARTYEELLAEAEEADGDAVEEEEEEEEEYIYNPLKLPLGWDGKPIPYWLYKLHGLNQEFRCEICGNAVYRGRRDFERHFKGFQHQQGMRALGIPNNKNFYEVTQIADALALWQNIQEREKGGFRLEADEEFEDAQGNVYDKKTYELMKRQGLI